MLVEYDRDVVRQELQITVIVPMSEVGQVIDDEEGRQWLMSLHDPARPTEALMALYRIAEMLMGDDDEADC